VSLICPVGKKRIVAFVRIGDEEVKEGAAEQHVHNVEEGYTKMYQASSRMQRGVRNCVLNS
jgi:hypothetical protein